MTNHGTAAVQWVFDRDHAALFANDTIGVLESGQTDFLSVTIDVGLLSLGNNDFVAMVLTNETGLMCVGTPSHPARAEMGYPCTNWMMLTPVTVDTESGDWDWIGSGLFVVPASHTVDVFLDKSVEILSSLILLDTAIDNGAAYEVLNTGGSECVSTLSVSGGASGELVRMIEQAVSSIVIGLSVALLAWCLALVIQDITGIQLLGQAASRGARKGNEAAEVLNPLAAGGAGSAAGKAGSAAPGSFGQLLGPAQPQTREPVWFGDSWDAAPSASEGGVHEVANPVAAALKPGAADASGAPGAADASGAPGARVRYQSVVTPNPLLGGRLSNAQDLGGARGGGGDASDWVRYLAYDGKYEYFHNTASGEVSWEQPSDFREDAGP